MNSRSAMLTSTTIAGMLAATVIVSLIVSAIIYAFKRKKAKTKKERKNLFLGIFIPTLIVVFVLECILMLSNSRL